MAISILAVLAIVAIAVLLVTGLKAGTDKGGEEVIKNVYIYLVLFATLMMTIGGSVGIFMAAADILSPVPYYQTYEEYKNGGALEKVPPGGISTVSQLPEEELQARYKAMVNAEKERQIGRAKNSLVKSFGWIVIPLPVFLYFQRRMLKKA